MSTHIRYQASPGITPSRGRAPAKTLATIFSSLFLLGGTLGFIPGVVKDDMFLGFFMVNTAHNIMHLATGTLFLLAAMLGTTPARASFLILGTLYAALAAVGFKVGDAMIFDLIANSRIDAWGHAGLATAMLLVGIFVQNKPERIAP